MFVKENPDRERYIMNTSFKLKKQTLRSKEVKYTARFVGTEIQELTQQRCQIFVDFLDQDGELCNNGLQLLAINYCCKALHLVKKLPSKEPDWKIPQNVTVFYYVIT